MHLVLDQDLESPPVLTITAWGKHGQALLVSVRIRDPIVDGIFGREGDITDL